MKMAASAAILVFRRISSEEINDINYITFNYYILR